MQLKNQVHHPIKAMRFWDGFPYQVVYLRENRHQAAQHKDTKRGFSYHPIIQNSRCSDGQEHPPNVNVCRKPEGQEAWPLKIWFWGIKLYLCLDLSLRFFRQSVTRAFLLIPSMSLSSILTKIALYDFFKYLFILGSLHKNTITHKLDQETWLYAGPIGITM